MKNKKEILVEIINSYIEDIKNNLSPLDLTYMIFNIDQYGKHIRGNYYFSTNCLPDNLKYNIKLFKELNANKYSFNIDELFNIAENFLDKKEIQYCIDNIINDKYLHHCKSNFIVIERNLYSEIENKLGTKEKNKFHDLIEKSIKKKKNNQEADFIDFIVNRLDKHNINFETILKVNFEVFDGLKFTLFFKCFYNKSKISFSFCNILINEYKTIDCFDNDLNFFHEMENVKDRQSFREWQIRDNYNKEISILLNKLVLNHKLSSNLDIKSIKNKKISKI